MNKEIFSKPLFWTNVVTVAFVLFLVATFVFGWSPPPLPPPQGNGVIQVDANADVVIGRKFDGSRRYIKDVETPPQQSGTGTGFANHIATVDYVEAATGLPGGGTSGGAVTMWGRCFDSIASGGNASCDPGEGTPLCSTLDVATGFAAGTWKQALAGYGPYVLFLDPTNVNPDNPASIVPNSSVQTSIDNLSLCSVQQDILFYSSRGANDVSQVKYFAVWPYGSPVTSTRANTCRICVR